MNKIKYNTNGITEIYKYKTRFVAKVYTKMEGIDCFDTLSPMTMITTIIVIFSITTIKGWHFDQLDVNNIFLHGDLN